MKAELSIRQTIAGLVLLSVVFGIPGLWVPYYNIDELTNSLFARFLNSGEMGLRDFLGNTYFLTHYLYAVVDRFAGLDNLIPMHVTHTFFKICTVMAFFWAGSGLGDRRIGLWSAAFYVFASVSFMSKDFHSPTAESFSLFPAVLAAGSFFRVLDGRRRGFAFAAGFLVGVAALFKAPMGITVAAMALTAFVRFRDVFIISILGIAGFLAGYFWPLFFYGNLTEAINFFTAKIGETNSYIQSYEGFSHLYWLGKFVIRLALVLAAWFAVTCFAFQSFRILVHLKRKHRSYWQKILFLWLWTALLAYAVSLGGRVFFHYFVFLLAPLCLLAGVGVKTFDTRLQAFLHHKTTEDVRFHFLHFVRKRIIWFLIIPALGFSVEGAFNYSTRPPDVGNVLEYLKNHTAANDRIYVWGNVPQLYYFSGRQPSTVFFWSDILAGTSPGSPAMEYVRATGKTLTLTEQLTKDFQPSVFEKTDIHRLNPQSTLSTIGENELFTLDELLMRIDHPYWRKVFADFFQNPPELFIDTSPTNIRGFGHTPIEKYELLKRFVLDNYRVEKVIDRMVIYRRQRHES